MRRQYVGDAILLACLIVASTLPYVAGLGFYSDDWAFLGSLTSHGDHSAVGRSAEHDFTLYLRPRPLQVLSQTVLHGLFGTAPAGYHVVNVVVLAAMVVLGYLLLRELGLPRLPALAAAVVFGLLPNYSTNRFWWAAFGYALSMLLAFASMYADLRAVRSRGRALWAWKAGALIALVVGVLGYEIALPLLVMTVPLLWYRGRRLYEGGLTGRLGRVGAAAFLGSNMVVLAGLALFKAATSVGTGIDGSYLLHLGRLAAGAVAVHLGSLGIGLPGATRWAIGRVDRPVLVAGIVAAAAFGVYLARLGQKDPSASWGPVSWLRVVAAGVAVFVLGYGIFATTDRILFTSTGISNRVALAPAAGLALASVGLAGTVSAIAPARWRAVVFAVPVAALALSSFLVVNGLATFWTQAWQRQQALLDDIRTRLPDLEPGTALILDGVCPYVGPAIVFESNWDLAGALETHYGDATLHADVTSASLTVGEEGLTTQLYGSQTAHYAYGPQLVVFDGRDGSVHPLPDADAAATWWAGREELECPGSAGYGVPIFEWDRRFYRFEDEYLWD